MLRRMSPFFRLEIIRDLFQTGRFAPLDRTKGCGRFSNRAACNNALRSATFRVRTRVGALVVAVAGWLALFLSSSAILLLCFLMAVIGVLDEWSRAPQASRPGGHPSPGPRSPP